MPKASFSSSGEKNTIAAQIRHLSLRLAILCLLPIIAIILSLYIIPFKEMFKPTPLAFTSLSESAYNSGTKYVEVTLTNVNYTGYDCTSNGRLVGSYYYSLVNDVCIFILVDTSDMDTIPAVLTDYTINAKIVPTDKMIDSIISKFSLDIGWTYDGLKSITKNVYIDETEYNLTFYRFLKLALILLLIVFGVYCFINILFIIYPAIYPACIIFRILTHGKTTISQIDEELTNMPHKDYNNLHISEHYIISSTFFQLDIIPIEHLVWVYEHTKIHRFLWFKSHISYSIHMTGIGSGHIHSAHHTKEETEAIVNHLTAHSPNLLVGFSKTNRKKAKETIKQYNLVKKHLHMLKQSKKKP